MMRYTLVAGTGGASRSNDFTNTGHHFQKTLACIPNIEPVSRAYPFPWDTQLDGVLGTGNPVWVAAGANCFMYHVPPLCPERRVKSDELLLITFSHGAQVALHAFALGMKGRLITVNPPIRKDMNEIAKVARPNIRRWLNLYGDWRDLWAILGAVGDGSVGITRQYPDGLCDYQELVPGGHGAALREQKYAGNWARWIQRVTL